MNAGPDALEGSGLLVKPNFEALALQQSGRSGSAKSGPDDGNSGCALHEINILDKSLICPQTKQVLAPASDARNQRSQPNSGCLPRAAVVLLRLPGDLLGQSASFSGSLTASKVLNSTDQGSLFTFSTLRM